MKGTPGRPVQYFSDDYLARCREMSPEEILGFLENFRQLRGTERLACQRDAAGRARARSLIRPDREFVQTI